MNTVNKSRTSTELPVYIINLKTRLDRRKHILHEFYKHGGYSISLVDAFVHRIGSIGLWNTIRYILGSLAKQEDDFIILCQDDHQFTAEYSMERLLKCIKEARGFDADILAGGISGFTVGMQISPEIFWVEKFSGLQFVIIFRKFFKTIVLTPYRGNDVFAISDDLTGAINQVLDQRENFQKEYYVLKGRSTTPIKTLNSKCIVIIGLVNILKTEEIKSFELFRSNSKDVIIVTFDELLERLKLIQSLMTS